MSQVIIFSPVLFSAIVLNTVSGGEMQRLVAYVASYLLYVFVILSWPFLLSSRTFMRLQSNKITCVTVDEPSSALDPQGELELFQRLRDARAGKTMIFVTHRFGHLTKHADLIMSVNISVGTIVVF